VIKVKMETAPINHQAQVAQLLIPSVAGAMEMEAVVGGVALSIQVQDLPRVVVLGAEDPMAV
jgi:hypothetical protein